MAGETVVTMRSGRVIPKQSIYEESVEARHTIGDSCLLPDGRVFYYAKNGAVALAAGYMCTQPANVANHRKCALAATALVGARRVSVTLGATALAANFYAGGFLHISLGTGLGGVFKVRSHLAIGSAGTGWFELYDPLPVALTAATSYATLSRNPWDTIVVYPATTSIGPAVGVPLIPMTIGYYGWLQTWGPAALNCITTMTIGQPVGVSATAGAGLTLGAFTTSAWGVVMNPNLTTEHSLVYLTIAP